MLALQKDNVTMVFSLQFINPLVKASYLASNNNFFTLPTPFSPHHNHASNQSLNCFAITVKQNDYTMQGPQKSQLIGTHTNEIELLKIALDFLCKGHRSHNYVF
jgi:hypothetical protein